jgi:hypothetical protein
MQFKGSVVPERISKGIAKRLNKDSDPELYGSG